MSFKRHVAQSMGLPPGRFDNEWPTDAEIQRGIEFVKRPELKVRMTAAVHPFKSERKLLEFSEGISVKDMVLSAQPESYKLRHAIVFINGKVVPRQVWNEKRPCAGELVELRAFPVPRGGGGGGGGGGKNILRIILTIAVVALAIAVAPHAAGALFPGLAAGSFGLGLATGVIGGVLSAAGTLAINALIPQRPLGVGGLSTPSLSKADSRDSNSYFIEGASNSRDPFGVVPVVLGKFRQTPRQGSKPYTEMIGDDQYLRMLFVWGIGPIEIDESSLKIGETLLTEFSDYQIEHREGYDDDADLTLFPEAISETGFNVALKQVTDWVVRTTELNADEIGIDISFAGGLVEFDSGGSKGPRTVNIEIEYSETGANDWVKIDSTGAKFKTNFDSAWLNTTYDLIDSIDFTAKKTSGLRFGVRWGVSVRGQYDVRVRRTTLDTDSSLIADATFWTVIRSIRNQHPVVSPVPIAMTALVIKATDQLNGIIDNFSGVVTRVCKDWNSGTETWVEQATQNPASLFRFCLQGNGMNEPLADARIDLAALQEWHEFCDEKGFKFNQVRDYSSSVWETLRDICLAGRAAPTLIDGKWSVVIDKEQTAPVSVITPRNSFEFTADKFFLNPPHGWRVQFSNENQEYKTDEYRVYADGYDDDNATKFEMLDLIGVTDPDQIYKLGRWRIAQGINQPERWTFKQDMEFLTYQRGDWIKIAHDVMLVGLATGRVKSVVTNEGGDVISAVLDQEVVMETGKTYGLVIRTLSDPSLSAQIVTVDGTSTSVVFTTPIAGIGSPAQAAIGEGDIFCFGEFGEETEDATVISIAPTNNLQATIVAIPYRPAIYAVDEEEIPEFETRITAQASIPAPVVIEVVSDETAMIVSSTGTLRVRIRIAFSPLNTSIFGSESSVVVQIRQHGTGENFYNAVVEEIGKDYLFIGDVRTGEIVDIRLRFKVGGILLPGAWAIINSHTVSGRSALPAALINMTVSAIGGNALIRWDRPSDIDVFYGGEVEFRHSPLLEDATWGSSVSIGQSAMARTLFAILPLKEGTYFARVYDVDGNASETITSVSTKQATANVFANVGELDEGPDFIGTKSGTEVVSNALKLIDGGSPEALSGTYEFAQGVDLGSVQSVRLTNRMEVSIYYVNDNVDARVSNIDDWADFDGSIVAAADAKVYVRHTDDDPTYSIDSRLSNIDEWDDFDGGGSPAAEWSAWERLDSAEFQARAFQFYAALERESLDYNIQVSELAINIDEIA